MMPYIHNRWIWPSDRVIIKHPDCPKGRYRDADTILLYAMFQVLVDYVEVECRTWGPYCFETTGQKLYRVIQDCPVLHWLMPPLRNARQGLHNLRWEMNLKDNPSQAQQARDVFTLYRWWKHTRPERVDPWEWSKTFTEPKRVPNGNFLDFTPEYSAKLDSASTLEEQYHQEDQEMLLLLVKIRRGLWT